MVNNQSVPYIINDAENAGVIKNVDPSETPIVIPHYDDYSIPLHPLTQHFSNGDFQLLPRQHLQPLYDKKYEIQYGHYILSVIFYLDHNLWRTRKQIHDNAILYDFELWDLEGRKRYEFAKNTEHISKKAILGVLGFLVKHDIVAVRNAAHNKHMYQLKREKAVEYVRNLISNRFYALPRQRRKFYIRHRFTENPATAISAKEEPLGSDNPLENLKVKKGRTKEPLNCRNCFKTLQLGQTICPKCGLNAKGGFSWNTR